MSYDTAMPWAVIPYVLVVIASGVAAYLLGIVNGALYVPTDKKILERMLDAAQLAPGDLLIDLGSGDGRLVIAAALSRHTCERIRDKSALGAHVPSEDTPPRARVAGFHRVEGLLVCRPLGRERGHCLRIGRIMERLERKLERELAPVSRVVCNLFPLPGGRESRGRGYGCIGDRPGTAGHEYQQKPPHRKRADKGLCRQGGI